MNEIIKMQEFDHPHVLPLIGVCLDTGPGVSMVLPFMTNGSLKDYLKKERSNLEIKEEDSEKVVATDRSFDLSILLAFFTIISYCDFLGGFIANSYAW